MQGETVVGCEKEGREIGTFPRGYFALELIVKRPLLSYDLSLSRLLSPVCRNRAQRVARSREAARRLDLPIFVALSRPGPALVISKRFVGSCFLKYLSLEPRMVNAVAENVTGWIGTILVRFRRRCCLFSISTPDLIASSLTRPMS